MKRNKHLLRAIGILSLIGLGLVPLSALAGRGAPKENSPFLLEEAYDREPDPKQRVLIAIKLSDIRMKEFETVFKREAASLQKEAGESYLGSVEKLGQAVDDALDSGYAKRAEQHLRRQLRSLENLKMAVSFRERPAVEQVAAQVSKIHEKVLYRIMQPRQEQG
ncbi:MAG: hypothetical protein HY648_01135 [Acidobacteria bacterium]|nr:hypothetical protein [Acidobacteriota bacterium]